MIYACNLLDEGFDNIDKIKNHILNVHKEIVSHIFTDKEEEHEPNERTEDKVVCDGKIFLDTGSGKCANICKYLDWVSEPRFWNVLLIDR